MLYPVKVRVKFSFRSQRYKNTKVTVHFNRGETLSGAMFVLKNLVPGLEYEVKKDEVIIRSAYIIIGKQKTHYVKMMRLFS